MKSSHCFELPMIAFPSDLLLPVFGKSTFKNNNDQIPKGRPDGLTTVNSGYSSSMQEGFKLAFSEVHQFQQYACAYAHVVL